MKKYILLGVITLAEIFNFSSATEYYGTSFKCSVGENTEYNHCGDDILYFGEEVSEYTINVSSNDGDVSLFGNYLYSLPNGPTNENIINYPLKIECNENLCNGFNIWKWGDLFDGVVDVSVTLPGGGEGGEGGNIVAGGINAFSGIIDRLGGIFGEFGPYIIYIAIACIGISLLFKALKYILGFTNNSAKNSIGGNRESRKKRKFNKFIGMRNRRNRRRFNRRHRNRPQRYNKIKYELNERR